MLAVDGLAVDMSCTLTSTADFEGFHVDATTFLNPSSMGHITSVVL